MSTPADDVGDWVRRSRAAQALPEKVTHTDTIAALAELIRVAQDTERARQAERSTRGGRGNPPGGQAAAADADL